MGLIPCCDSLVMSISNEACGVSLFRLQMDKGAYANRRSKNMWPSSHKVKGFIISGII